MDKFVERFDEHLLFSLERRYLDFIDPNRLELAINPCTDIFDYRSHLRMIRLDEISHEGNARHGLHLLHMQNILAAMKDDSHTFVSMVRSDGMSNSMYYGLARRLNSQTTISTHEYTRMLGATMHGNFLGARFTHLSADDTWDQVIAPLAEHDQVLAFPGIPSLRIREQDAPYVQGMDRFIEGMRGEKYCLLVIAEPIQVPNVDGMITNLFDLGSSIHAHVRTTIQKMKGSSDTINIGMFGFRGTGDSYTAGTSETTTSSETESSTRLGAGGILGPLGGITGLGAGAALGAKIGFIGGPAGALIGATVGAGIGAVGAFASGLPLASSDAFTKASSFTRSIANTTSNMAGLGGMGGYARSWNRSTTVGREELNKTAEHCEKLTDAYIERLQKGKNLGFWNVGVYLLTQNKYTQLRAEGLLRACVSGDETYWEPVRSVTLNPESLGKYLINFNNPLYNLFLYGEETRNVEEAVSVGKRMAEYASRLGKSVGDLLGLLEKADPNERARMLEEIRQCPGNYSREIIDQAWEQIREIQLGHPLGPVLGGVGTPLNTEELSIIMNVPRQEIQGVTIRSSTSFGVNYSIPTQVDCIRLGRVIHKRLPVDTMPYILPRKLLQKHMFICGVTGSGKTNTCMGLLSNLDLPFMVIEPAKTEYRQMLSQLDDLKIFTLGREDVSPFRINPFEFSPGCNLLTHVDNLKSVFSAAFPMYAAMPYILEEAIIEVYQDKGWELATSTNVYMDVSDDTGYRAQNSEQLSFHDFLPTMRDLYEKIDDVVNRKQYAQEQSMNYSAALKARISSLLTGSKGLMLNARRSTPIETLLNSKVVLELKNIGDDEEKCFLMGLILSAIYEYRESNGKPGSPLQHVLLIEEAHRLLRRVPDYVSPEVGNTRGKAVETFANVISEIRTLGQGLVVVDQIPSKLTQDVIKNTNMKIVHRTLAIDDRQSVGSTMNLTEEQSRELSLLEVGQAVIHRESMDKAFLVMIDLFISDQTPFVSDLIINDKMRPFHTTNAFIFRRYPGFEKHPDIPATYAKTDFRIFDKDIYFALMGAFVMMIMDETNRLPEMQSNFNKIIHRKTRKSSEIQQSCLVIYYAATLFSELNAKYPGCYDRCMIMNQAFIDLWFDNSKGIYNSINGKMDEVLIKQLVNTLRENMIYLRQDERLTIPFFAYYMNQIDPDTPNRIKQKWEGGNQDMKNLSEYIQRVLRVMLSGVSITESKEFSLCCDFLEMIFWTDHRKPDILLKYKQFKKSSSL